MFAAVKPQLLPLDVPTLAFVAVCIAALLGLLLLFAWVQQRNVRALAWWGSASARTLRCCKIGRAHV